MTLQTRLAGWLHLLPALLVCAVLGSGVRALVASAGHSSRRAATRSLAITAEPPDDRIDDQHPREALLSTARARRVPAPIFLDEHALKAPPAVAPRRIVRPQKKPSPRSDAVPPA